MNKSVSRENLNFETILGFGFVIEQNSYLGPCF